MPRADRARRVARLVSVLGSEKQSKTNAPPSPRHGLTVSQIQRATGASRATVYRDLKLLRESDYALETTTVNGEARYALSASELSSRPMTPRQRAAIALARRALHGVDGTWLTHELDALLERAREVAPVEAGVMWQLGVFAFDPALLALVHRGVTTQRVLRLRYRGARDKTPQTRTVHPQRLFVVDQQPYLIAWDEQKRARRTFKLARVTQAKLLRSKARQIASESSAETSGAKSVKVWQDDPCDVRIRIAASVARYVHEWPLVPEQQLEPAPAGAVDVCARVFGIEEPLRWVLRWGANACVIAPEALRARVAAELRGALKGYGIEVSHDRETRGVRER